MATPPPEIFTLTFWQTTTSRVVHCAAAAALGAWVGTATAARALTFPGWTVATAGAVGALYALLASLAGGPLPATQSLPLAALFPKPSQRIELHVVDRAA